MALYELSKESAKIICNQINDAGGNILEDIVQHAIKCLTVQPLDPYGSVKTLATLGKGKNYALEGGLDFEDDEVILTLNPCDKCDLAILNCLPQFVQTIDLGIIKDTALPLTKREVVFNQTSNVPVISGEGFVLVSSTQVGGILSEIWDLVIKDVMPNADGQCNNFSLKFRVDFATGKIWASNVTGAWDYIHTLSDSNNATFRVEFTQRINFKVILEESLCCRA